MAKRSHSTGSGTPWLLRHGLRVRRVLGGLLLAIPLAVYVTGPSAWGEAEAAAGLCVGAALLASLITVHVAEGRLAAHNDGGPDFG